MQRCVFTVVLTVLFASSACVSAPAFQESFAHGTMDAGWQAHCSAGGSITVHDGVAEISSDVNAYAHLSRPLVADNVTVSSRIKPSQPTGVTWCTSIFIVWNGANWCQMGMIQGQNGPCYYVVETINGATTETFLEQCDVSKPHFVRIQLGTDVIRYLAGDDGKIWKCMRIFPRPDSFNGAPATLVAGKGYGRGVEPYARPELDNDYADRGPKVVSQIADISVEETPAALLRLTSEERIKIAQTDVDPVGVIELQGKADTSYERMIRYYPAMKYPKEAVGVPEHPVDIAVDHLGRLQLNYNQPPVAWLEFGDQNIPFGDEKSIITRRWREGYLPVLTLTTRHDGVEYRQTVLGWSEGMSPDKPLWAYMWFNAVPLSRTAKAPDYITLVANGKRTRFELGPKKFDTHMVFLKMQWPSGDDAQEIIMGEYGPAIYDMRMCWTPYIARGAHFEVPEKRVMDAYRAWLAYAQLDVDKVNGIYEPHDGVGFYEENYGYSCTLHCIALDMYGYHDKAALYLDSILHFQEPDGLYTQNFGLPDMGTLLLALVEHYNYTGDKAWLKKMAPTMIKTADWIIRKRADAPKEGPLKGLIKYRAYCDYATPVYDYFADTYCVVGMEAAANALMAIGMTADAQRIGNEAKAYRADILASMDQSVIERDGRKYLPLEPETHRLLKDSQYTGGDYYGLVTGCLLENGFLPANDRRTYLLTDLMEQKKGLIAGLCKFQSGGIDHAYTYGYLMTQMKRGDARKVILGFYSMLAYGMSRDTYSGVECTNIVTGNNYWTLPHLYSATQQLRLFRNMIVREEGDILRIGDAIPRAWLADGKSVKANQAPTRFGDVSFTITSQAKKGSISVRLSPPARQTPRQIAITLRNPSFAQIKSVTLNGRPYKRFKGETITLEGIQKPVTLQVIYK